MGLIFPQSLSLLIVAGLPHICPIEKRAHPMVMWTNTRLVLTRSDQVIYPSLKESLLPGGFEVLRDQSGSHVLLGAESMVHWKTGLKKDFFF